MRSQKVKSQKSKVKSQKRRPGFSEHPLENWKMGKWTMGRQKSEKSQNWKIGKWKMDNEWEGKKVKKEKKSKKTTGVLRASIGKRVFLSPGIEPGSDG